jgi:hypothetical protein
MSDWREIEFSTAQASPKTTIGIRFAPQVTISTKFNLLPGQNFTDKIVP